MARRLFVDIDSARLVGGFEGGSAPAPENLFRADNTDYELYFLKESESARRYEMADFSGSSIKLHIGAHPPSSATAFVAAETWTNLPATVSATVARTITGGAATAEQQRVTFSPEAVEGTFSLTFPSQALTFSALSAGVFTTSGSHGLSLFQPWKPVSFTTPTGFSNNQTLYVASIIDATRFLASDSPAGSAITAFTATSAGTGFTITASTRALPARAEVAELQNALQELPPLGANSVSVSGQPGRNYVLSFSGAKGQVALPLMSVASSLTPVIGKTGTINFNTVELTNAISASATIEAVMEIETSAGGKTETVLQVPVTLRNELIATGSPLPISTISGSASFALLAPDNSTWLVSIDNDGILTATKQ
jgi:hypothetical protein